ncbi:MAG: response regulator [Desulfobacterales bacterium]
MTKKVLFVDDDPVLCHIIQKKFARYKHSFTVITAGDGLEALEKLKENTIALVVTDLQMPKMDGLSLLAHLSEKYPDIQVIIQTGHSTPESKMIALERGAAGYIEKPLNAEDLGQKIITTLKKESEGGTLQSITLEMFLQLIEMEQKTCTIRVVENKSGKQGALFFKDGDLLDARFSAHRSNSAAYEIFSWGKVALSIQYDCAIKKKKIDGDLQALLIDAVRLRDEAGDNEKLVAETQENKDIDESKPKALPLEDIISNKLEEVKGGSKYLKEIYQDNSWSELVTQASEVGKFFVAGTLKSCYIDRGEATNFILLPGKEITVISIDPKCPRDRFLRALNK